MHIYPTAIPNWSVDYRPDPTTLDPFDPASWQYLTLDDDTSMNIVKGYTEFWNKQLYIRGVKNPEICTKETAQIHRDNAWQKLCQAPSPLQPVFRSESFAPNRSWVPFHITFDSITRGPSVTKFCNPFQFLKSKLVDNYYISGKGEVDEKLWDYLAKKWLQALATQPHIKFYDSVLTRIGLFDRKLPDGAIYQSGSILAHPPYLIGSSPESVGKSRRN